MKNNLRFSLLLTLFIPFVFSPLMAQLPFKISIVNKSIPQLKRDTENYSTFQETFAHLTTAQRSSTKTMIKTFTKPSPFNGVSARPLALFCRIEVFLEKKNGMPIKFRLGDIDKVDQLEGKFLW